MSTPEVVIYCRYSPRPVRKDAADESLAAAEDAQTIKQQIDACERYAVMRGLTVTRIIRDPETSARSTPLFERDGGQQLKDLPAGSHILAYKLDRMFRRTVDGLTTMEYFKERDIRLHFADQGGCTIDVSTAVGELLTTTLLAQASFEPRQTSERTAAAYVHLTKQGKRMTATSCIRYGNRHDASNDKVAVDPVEIEMIHRARELRQSGMTLDRVGESLISEFGHYRGRTTIHRFTVSEMIKSDIPEKSTQLSEAS